MEGKDKKEVEIELTMKEDWIPEPSISFKVAEDNSENEILKFTEDKMFLRGKETECPQDIIDGMRAWLRQWNYLANPPVDNGNEISISKTKGELVVLVDNEDMLLRLQVNPWNLKVSDYQYNLK